MAGGRCWSWTAPTSSTQQRRTACCCPNEVSITDLDLHLETVELLVPCSCPDMLQTNA